MHDAPYPLGDPEEQRLQLEQLRRRVQQERVSGDILQLALALSDLGTCYLALGQPGKALSPLQKALDLFERLDQIAQERRVTGSIGLALAFLGQAQAESFLEVGLNAAIEEGDVQRGLLLSQNLAAVLLRLHQLERARVVAEHSLDMCLVLDDSEQERGGIEQVLGMIALGQGQISDAIEHFLQGLHAIENSPPALRGEFEATTSRYLANAYFQTGNDKEAIRWSEQSERLYTELQQPDMQFAVAYERALFAVEQGSRDAIHYGTIALEQARGQSDPHLEINALSLLGTAYREAGKKRKALASWTEGAAIADELKDAEGASRLHFLIGDLRSEMGHSTQAFTHYHAAMQYAKRLNDLVALARAYEALAVLEGPKGYVEYMQGYFQASRECYRQLDDRLGEALSFLLQAEILSYFQDFDGRDVSLLGLLRYSLDLLQRLPSIDDPLVQEAIRRGDTLLEAQKTNWGEEWYERMWLASEAEYARHAAQSEEERAFHIWRKQTLASEIEGLGLLPYERGYGADHTEEAISLIRQEDMGYRHLALSSYEQALHRFRRQHDRLAEAIIEGTMALIHQVLNPGGEEARHQRAFQLFRESGDLVGQGRALYNEAIRLASLPDSNEQDRLAYLRAACFVLERAQADPAELGAARTRLDAMRARMGEQAYHQAQNDGQRRYQRLLPQAGYAGIYRLPQGPGRDLLAWHRLRAERVRVAQAESLLEAIPILLSLALEEVRKETLTQQVGIRYTGTDAELTVTIGVGRLEDDSIPAINPDGGQDPPLIRVRFLKRDWHDRENPFQMLPIRHQSAEGMQPEIQLITRAELIEQAIDYLDLRAVEAAYDARAIEILNQDEQQVIVLECHYSMSSGITDFLSDLLPLED